VSGGHDSDFDAARWWETGQGIRIFTGEIMDYVVAAWQLRSRPSAHAGFLLAPALHPFLKLSA
jgi:hypothetical protein